MLNLNGCNFSDTTVQATSIAYFFTFYILLPYYLTVGFLLNILLIVSLAKRVKEKPIFAYQLLVVCGKTFDNAIHGYYYAAAFWWAGMGGYVAPWFAHSYALMYFTMRVIPAAVFVGVYLSLFFSVAMTTDRVVALWKPILYTKINHSIFRSVLVSICLILTIAISLDKYWTYNIVEIVTNETVSYGYRTDTEFVNTQWCRWAVSIRTYVRAGLVITLIISNILMIYLYRRRMNRLKRITMASEERIRARKEANKDLLVMSICQSILTCLDQIPNCVPEMLRTYSTYWNQCYVVLTPEYTGVTILATSTEFFLLLAVNRKIRTAVPGYETMRKLCGKSTTVQHVNPHPN